MANNVRQMRIDAGLSQARLAEKVGASRLEIQRIEANRSPAPVGVAKAICAALGQPMERVFPGAGEALADLAEALHKPTRVPSEMYARLRGAGIEGDIRRHTLNVLLRGHHESLFFWIQAADADRLFSAIQNEGKADSNVSFVVFDSDEFSVALSLRHLVFCHFLWDVDAGAVTEDAGADSDDEGPSEKVQIYFNEITDPVIISVDGDLSDNIEDEDSDLNNILFSLQIGVPVKERLHLLDSGGESAFLRAGDIALLTIPHWALHPDLWDTEEEEEGTGDDDFQGHPDPNKQRISGLELGRSSSDRPG